MKTEGNAVPSLQFPDIYKGLLIVIFDKFLGIEGRFLGGFGTPNPYRMSNFLSKVI